MLIIQSLILSTAIGVVDITIDQVLPDTAIATISIDNIQNVSQSLKQSGLCTTIFNALCEGSEEGICPLTGVNYEDFLSSLDLNDGEHPFQSSGKAGFGVYPIIDYESGDLGIGLLTFIELNDSKHEDFINSSFHAFSEQMQFEYEVVELAGREVWMATLIEKESGPMSSTGIDQYGIEIQGFNRCYVDVTDGYLVICTEPDGLVTFFDVLDGNGNADSLSDSDVYKALIGRIDQESDLQATVMIDNLADALMQKDTSGMAMAIVPMLKSFIGNVDGIAESVQIAPDDETMFDVHYTFWMGEGRNGLMSIVGNETIDPSIPGFVGPDTLSYAQTSVDLDKVAPFIQEIISENHMFAMRVGPEIDSITATIELALKPLGSELIVVSTGRLPVSETSMGYLIAIECIDEEGCNNFLNMMLPSIGAQPTEFLGYQMFSTDLGSAMPLPIPMELSVSFSTAGGYLLIGSTHAVRGALRTIANPREAYEEHASNDAADSLKARGITGWGYGDPGKSMIIQAKVAEVMTDEMFTEMEAFDPVMAAEFRKEYELEQATQQKLMETIASILGPMAWNFSTDEFGFTARALLMNPN